MREITTLDEFSYGEISKIQNILFSNIFYVNVEAIKLDCK